MPRNSPNCLRRTIRALGSAREGALLAFDTSMRWDESICGSMLPHGKDLSRRSVLLATVDQSTAAALLLELDGVADRLVLYPPDLSFEHLPYVARAASVDTIVTDRPSPEGEMPSAEWLAPVTWHRTTEDPLAGADRETEWVLLTSGTTGRPKLVVHTLSTLAGAIEEERPAAKGVVWSTFYDIRRYGGLQIFLRAALTGASLVLASAKESTADFLARAGARGVTHLSGTPSHWRRAAMSIAAGLISPQYVRLSGEIADQAILNHLQQLYPRARIAHAFATTEAGVVFTVNDGLMGFPLNVLRTTPNVELKVENNSLLVRSQRTALCYLGNEDLVLKDADGFVNTGDVLEERSGRFYFAGRGDGVINVGGRKVHPEEVEAVLNGHPEVHMSLVRTKKSAIVGAVVIADVVLKHSARHPAGGTGELHSDILRHCRETLDTYKVPASINFVRALPVAESGKLLRLRA